jgi:hypothetical protein
MFRWLLFPAVTMSLGWGLRGYIGGGSLGAMIPGAMVALVLCLLLRRSAGNTALVAALGAVGFGFGGQETYGNTIQLALAEATRWWGLGGLALKGAVWGLLGGGLMGLALERARVSPAGLVAMVAGTWAGWHFINVPRQLGYFSIDRGEVWAGLLLGALTLLVVERSALAWRFALVTALGGGVGFGLGGWLQVWGRWNAPQAWVGWWKVMEFFFGACLGLALGWSGGKWGVAEPVIDDTDDSANRILASLVIAGALYAEHHGELRFVYTISGACLIALVSWRPAAGILVGLLMTIAAFAHDVARDWRVIPMLFALVIPDLSALLTPLRMLLVLTWSANLLATVKALGRHEFRGEHALFLLLGMLISAMAARARHASLPTAADISRPDAVSPG